MKLKLLLITFILNSFNSCDILRTSEFEVVSWSPGGGYHSEPENITVSINFSNEPDKANIERNFSLIGNSIRVKGSFNWNGNSMTFNPLTPFETNADYVITISADAHDTEGLSLDREFNGHFTTRQDGARPVLISFFPSLYDKVSDPRAEILLNFSLPVPLITLYENITFTPSMTGYWQLKDEGKQVVFTPAEPWIQNTRYDIRLSASLSDNNGMTTGKDYTITFTAGTFSEIPYLKSVSRILKDGSIIPLDSDRGYAGVTEFPVENSNIEKDDKFIFVFSKPADSASVKNYISIEDGPGLIMETAPGFKENFIFRFESIPAYESRFTVKIKSGIKDISNNETKEEYIYRIFADGKYSKPPELAGIRIPMAPYNETDQKMVFCKSDSLYSKIPITDEYYPSGQTVNTWIELYFETAQDASINLFSLMDLFQTETSNNVISFSPRYVKQNNFTVTNPQKGYEDYLRIEIRGEFENTTNFGVIYFQIGAGLMDSHGNKNEKQQRIPLLK
ncbi:MAG: Ig-like domain-containing protein [Treponema sp.]|nr:Ig-like domain-containing protein [Treponema sp.]